MGKNISVFKNSFSYSADVKSSTVIKRFDFVYLVTVHYHALSMCILRSLCLLPNAPSIFGSISNSIKKNFIDERCGNKILKNGATKLFLYPLSWRQPASRGHSDQIQLKKIAKYWDWDEGTRCIGDAN